MKTLTDIQAELKQFSEQIKLLTGDIEKLKPKSVDQIQKVYSEIMELARRYPICNKQLIKASDITKKYYLYYLAIIADKESDEAVEQLLFISRIAYGIQYEVGIEEIVKDAMSVKEEIFSEGLEIIGNLKYSLILDMLIIVNIMGCASTEKLTQIADLALLAECNQEDIKILSILASAILKNSASEFSKIATTASNKWRGKFIHIIPTEWIVSYRSHCGFTEKGSRSLFFRIPSEKEITYSINKGTLVKKGDKLLEYNVLKRDLMHLESKSINATQDGMVFMKKVLREDDLGIKDTITQVYVVSPFDDYEDFCKWVENK